jgi:hypothetical protein
MRLGCLRELSSDDQRSNWEPERLETEVLEQTLRTDTFPHGNQKKQHWGGRHKMITHKKTTKNVGPNGKAAAHSIVPYEPAIEEIRTRAYEVYVERGRIDGFDLENWLQAEEELKQSRNKPTD